MSIPGTRLAGPLKSPQLEVKEGLNCCQRRSHEVVDVVLTRLLDLGDSSMSTGSEDGKGTQDGQGAWHNG